MSVVAATRPPAADTAPRASVRGSAAAALARIEIFRDMAAAEPFWRALERGGAFKTPYQAFDFLDLWQRHMGAGEGVTPFIVTGFDAAGKAVFVLPFGRRRGAAGLRVVEFLGGKHANFNMGLWRADFLGALTALDLEAVRGALRGEADVVILGNQPLAWAGRDNPFALLPHQASPSFGFAGPLTRDFEALFNERTSAVGRRKMRKKERTLAEAGTVTFARATSEHDIRRVAEDFYAQKSARMRAIGLPDVFAAQDVRDFVTAGALTPADGSRLIELYTLSVDATIVAPMGGVCADGRFSAMFSSIIHGRFGTESPGEQLLVRVVRDCCERGLHTFDLGVGEASYKSMFCEAEPMFDSYWPLSARGRAFAAARRGFAAAKRAVKQNPYLWKVIVAARRIKARLTKADSKVAE